MSRFAIVLSALVCVALASHSSKHVKNNRAKCVIYQHEQEGDLDSARHDMKCNEIQLRTGCVVLTPQLWVNADVPWKLVQQNMDWTQNLYTFCYTSIGPNPYYRFHATLSCGCGLESKPATIGDGEIPPVKNI